MRLVKSLFSCLSFSHGDRGRRLHVVLRPDVRDYCDPFSSDRFHATCDPFKRTLVTFGIIVAALWAQVAFCIVLVPGGTFAARQRDDCRCTARRRRTLVAVPLHRFAHSFVHGRVHGVDPYVIMSLRNFDMIAVMTQGGPYGSSTVLAYQMFDATIFSFRAGYGAAIRDRPLRDHEHLYRRLLWHSLRQEPGNDNVSIDPIASAPARIAYRHAPSMSRSLSGWHRCSRF